MVTTNMTSIRHMSVSDKPYDKTNQRQFKEGKGRIKKSFIFSQISKKNNECECPSNDYQVYSFAIDGYPIPHLSNPLIYEENWSVFYIR